MFQHDRLLGVVHGLSKSAGVLHSVSSSQKDKGSELGNLGLPVYHTVRPLSVLG